MNKQSIEEAAEKWGSSFKTGSWFEKIRIESFIAGANWHAQSGEGMKYIRADKQLPPVGIYHALYNGDHIIFQVHDGGFRTINYHGEKCDNPKLNLVKWLPESQAPINDGLIDIMDVGKKLAQATSNLIQDIKRKPNDTRYATHTKKAIEALENWLNKVDILSVTLNPAAQNDHRDTPNNVDY
jgi:hypothetical protein